jgi:deoxyguanosine kinase
LLTLQLMKFQNSAILSLGSNLGNRLERLQQGISYIHSHIATVIKISGVYETPAWGFEGEAFYNCALLVHTNKTAGELLEGLLTAEAEGGRVRSATGEYTSRTMDIDIIAFNDEVIDEPFLQVPHPRMAGRNFVLYPLRDVLPHWVHPILNIDIDHLIAETDDTSHCKRVEELPLPLHVYTPQQFNYIAIEGNIGAGKTSLALKISEDFNALMVPERFADNPFLPKFYADQARYAFPLEMSFLADRYQQLTDDLSQTNLENDFVVADYYIVKSLIFSKVTLSEDEYRLYHRLFDIMYKELPKPGLYIYLYQSTERLLQQIKKRGRDYEQDITAEYLDNISRGYLDFIKSASELNVLVIDVTDRDFVNRQEDYLWLLNEIGLKSKG